MIDPSDTPDDDAWDDVPNVADDEKPQSGQENSAKTVPPPPSGDAYSADTVIRDVPREALDAIREKQRAERLAAKSRSEDLPKISGDENPSAETRAAMPAPEDVADATKPTPVASPAPAVVPSEPKKALPVPRPSVEKAPREPAPTPAVPSPVKARYVGPDPVTSSELLIAVAGAVIAVVAGFYLISSAF